MSLLPLMQWIDETQWSTALHESLYMYPLTESFHVWALSLFVGLTVILDLRLLGLIMKRVPVSEVARRLLPWTIAGFIVMVVTGFMLFYAIPVRTYQSIWFRSKAIMLILAGINAWVFHAGIWRSVTRWDLDPVTPKAARRAGAFSLVLWAFIIITGRMIAYNWFDCDRQPQPAIVNLLAGCVVESEQ